jgi:hypothetical protein
VSWRKRIGRSLSPDVSQATDVRVQNKAHDGFVRKRMPEIQYLQATISEEQRQEFGMLVANTIERIESGSFLPHSRFVLNKIDQTLGWDRDSDNERDTISWSFEKPRQFPAQRGFR